MIKVNFYNKEEIDEFCLKFTVIVARSAGKWVFCKHKKRSTYELPGGHREENETILDAAERELREETGAIAFDIVPVCVYSVKGKTRVNASGEETYGMLYYAEIETFEKELHSEMERVELFAELPVDWTYPQIQPLLLVEVRRRLDSRDFMFETLP